MKQVDTTLSTGVPGVDGMLRGLIPGDNLVWQVDCIEDFLPFADPYCRNALESPEKLTYLRFAKHPPLTSEADGAEVHHLQPEAGFEQFVVDIQRIITDVGKGGYYIFDSLSGLAVDWYSDQMLGNFFRLTCPYLWDMDAIAYFPLLRNHHSAYATSPIADTAQILIDVVRDRGTIYLHPLKVQYRHSPTMYTLHAWRGENFVPITQSAMISDVLRSVTWGGLESPSRRLDVWHRAFFEAEETLAAVQRGDASADDVEECRNRLLRAAISRQERMLELAAKHLTLQDLLEIGRRIVGTGLIGGKSVGMLLARAMLQHADPRWGEVLEPHDSFYIGSDVFYTFIVTNDIWWIRQQQRASGDFLEGSQAARERILEGTFPEDIQKQFADMLDYFGQSPIIVRSSSLLEDSFGNAFAGKYESVFCVNQGSRQERMENFLAAVRTVYASTMSEDALTYRSRRGLREHNEQMALLVQRVSGAMHDDLFFPQVAGVGLSLNPYVWSKQIDPQSGVLRLVLGLGTRAVDSHDDDYTQVVALNAPQLRPQASLAEAKKYTQRKVDVLDLKANELVSKSFANVVRKSPDLPLEMLTSPDNETVGAIGQPHQEPLGILTFERFLAETPFVEDMREMLSVLHDAYDHPVDIEYTANFLDSGLGEDVAQRTDAYRINLLQCRPFQCKDGGTVPPLPEEMPSDRLLLEAREAVIGRSREVQVDRMIFVTPSVYGNLPIGDRHRVARLIGRITHHREPRRPEITMLLGPGRWGTSTPWLGVPVRFAEISSVSILCEIAAMREGLTPKVSLGTHLFSDMVEADMLYLALSPRKEGNFLNEEFFAAAPNRFAELLPGAAEWAKVIRVIDTDSLGGPAVIVNANLADQRVVCYLDQPGS